MAERPAPDDAAAPPAASPGPTRERRWGGTLSALVAFLLVPATPLLRTVVPIQETWVLLIPALAVCTLVGWRAGGRATLAILWCALAYWVLGRPLGAGGASGSYDLFARGWGFLLAGAFGVVYLLGKRQRFFPAALSSVALALTGAGVIVALSGDPGRLRHTTQEELARRTNEELAVWDAKWRSDAARQALDETPGAEEAVAEARDKYAALPPIAATLAPAMLALASLAALALAWGLYHRMSRVRIGLPLAPLRQFRFNDQLIWGVIVGVTLLVLPTLAGWHGAGANLTLFFGTLYALRGLGVLSFFLAPGWLMTLILTLLAPMMWPFYAVGALGLGLGDTWLDWRRRARPTT